MKTAAYILIGLMLILSVSAIKLDVLRNYNDEQILNFLVNNLGYDPANNYGESGVYIFNVYTKTMTIVSDTEFNIEYKNINPSLEMWVIRQCLDDHSLNYCSDQLLNNLELVYYERVLYDDQGEPYNDTVEVKPVLLQVQEWILNERGRIIEIRDNYYNDLNAFGEGLEI